MRPPRDCTLLNIVLFQCYCLMSSSISHERCGYLNIMYAYTLISFRYTKGIISDSILLHKANTYTHTLNRARIPFICQIGCLTRNSWVIFSCINFIYTHYADNTKQLWSWWWWWRRKKLKIKEKSIYYEMF